MKHRITNFFKRKFKRKTIVEPVEVVHPENYCLIDNIGNIDFILCTWVNKNHAWTMVIQTRKEGVLTTQFNHHHVSNRRVVQLGIRFDYNEIQNDVTLKYSNEEDRPFITSTTFTRL